MHCHRYESITSRREFITRAGLGIGSAALATLFRGTLLGAEAARLDFPNFAPKAKRVICLFQSGGPSQLELFDHKPLLRERMDQDLPDSVRQGQRVTGMVAAQARFALQPSRYEFKQCGPSGAWISDLLPYTQQIAGDICLINSMHTDAINHDPAITLFQTGSQQPGRPSIGSWLDYGLGSLNENLPSFLVLTSIAAQGGAGQGLLSRLWGSGFLSSRHQGVQLRGAGEPVPYLADAPGLDRAERRSMLDRIAALNGLHHDAVGDPEIESRIAQYEMAYRMQTSVPEVLALDRETDATMALYGEDVKRPGTFARNCLLARRLAENGVRFIQLYHRDWDHHGDLTGRMPSICKEIDQPSAALITDLKQRGLLDDTLVIWGGEFGRTPYAQGGARQDGYGRDHHGRAFSLWMAGGGIKPGTVFGATDDFGFNIVQDPVHIHDLQATLLHCLGIDHTKLTYKFQGRQFRLTDVHGEVVKGVLA